MSILDLQGLDDTVHKGPGGSRTSKGCTVSSSVSLLVCILVL